MGKRQSKPSIQAWISRESPEGGCVIINDTSSQTRLLEEILKQKKTVTAYEGYLVNEEDNLEPVGCGAGKYKSEEDFPIEIVELPGEPDGKHIDIHFVKEGNLDEATQTPSVKDIDCGVSVRSMSSDRQQWSFSLYNFEDNGRISKEDLTNLVRSIYDALGKSVDKAKQGPKDEVKKVKVHISVAKEKKGKEMQGKCSVVPRREVVVGSVVPRREVVVGSVVPRRAVVVGAEDGTAETEKKLEQLQLKESPGDEALRRSRKRREKEERMVKVLNNDLSKVHLHFAKCKSCWSAEDKHCNMKRANGQSGKNNNLLADKPNLPTRKQTGPGGCISDGRVAIVPEDLAQITEKKSKSRSQRRSPRRKATHSGHASPDAHVSGYSTPVGDISGHKSPKTVGGVLDPSYAYHTEDSNYVYVHAAPRQTPFQEPRSGGRRKSKHRRARDSSDKPEGTLLKIPGGSSVVHKHEHVHHHYHHYNEKH